ncbi:hypothetical protein TRSC58_05057 [Trypanosoma rangeli SC58]|uniref:Schlafen AlbA-2 domain-containing protein n=1 Tax=Trypanosoma rangeli SC58 TaxID=429131 RepID=A0A061IVS7_TRYRA|nr:hypothetical protein TRSC58_05057 [Trypanosoma rangeli SC58]
MCAVATEVDVAHLLAAAANCCDGSAVVTVQLRLLHVSSDSHAGWSRREKDMLLLCLDRAMPRVYPPLDPLQYTQALPEFLLENGVRVVRLRIMPSARFSLSAPVLHQVEGNCPPPRLTPADTTNNYDALVASSAAGQCEEDEDAAVLMRRRWRKAAWITARVFNEGSWCAAERGSTKVANETVGSSCNDVSNASILDAAVRFKEKRLLHVDVFGMEFVGLIVALTSRYAYVAVPFPQDGQPTPPWSLVSRVGIPSLLAEAKATLTRKRERGECATDGFTPFINEEELVLHDLGPLRRLPPGQRVRVVLRAHKVYCKYQRSMVGGPAPFSVVFEDVAAISCAPVEDPSNLLESLPSYLDLLKIVCASCTRFLRGYSKYMGTSANSAEERLFTAITDTVSVHMKRLRGREGQSPVTVASPQEIPSLVEGTCVEFKAKIDKWQDGANAVSPGQQKRSIVNLERIRHTVAAMASTLGGVLLVGVTDDGEVIGHARGALRELRLSGFCPAMVKGGVMVTEMRAVRGEPAMTMPKDWWKATKRQPHEQLAVEGTTDRVVTVVTVRRGPAPFYAPSRHSVPYMRGFASTVPLHVVVCARRIAELLP